MRLIESTNPRWDLARDWQDADKPDAVTFLARHDSRLREFVCPGDPSAREAKRGLSGGPRQVFWIMVGS